MELAGLVLAGPAVVTQLIHFSISGYETIAAARLAGTHLRQQKRQLEVAQERLVDWVRQLHALGGDLEALLGPATRRYILCLETLGLIAGVFVEVERLQGRYEGHAGKKWDPAVLNATDDSPGASKAWTISSHDADDPEVATESRRERWLGKRLFRKLRRTSNASETTDRPRLDSSSHAAPETSSPPSVMGPSSERPKSPVFKMIVTPDSPAVPTPDRERPEITALSLSGGLELSVPGAHDMVARMERQAEEYQNAMSLYRQYKWVFNGKEQLEALIKDLKQYTADLESLTKAVFKEARAVNKTFQPTQSPPLPPFSPYRVPLQLPFSRESKFTGREDVLAKLVTILDTSKSTRTAVVLHGMGGIGKSMIALEFAYRNSNTFTGVFWIDAKNPDTVNSSALHIMEALIAHYATRYDEKPDFMRIATDLGIPGKLDARGQLISDAVGSVWEMVKGWLAKGENRNWCLVIDGCDNDSLADLLPPCGHGHVLVTSRLRTTAAGIGADLIDIQEIEKEGALQLLLKGVGKKIETLDAKAREAAEKIIEILGALPLALAQAAAYMQATAREFVEYLRRLIHDLSRAVSRPFPSYPDGVFTCWKLSVESLNASNPDAIHVLRLCSFLRGDGVPEELLFRGIEAIEWVRNDQGRLEDAIDDLVKFSLMKRKIVGEKSSLKALYIHPLVQLWARQSYSESGILVQEHAPEKIELLRKSGAIAALKLVSTAIEVEPHARQEAHWQFETTILPHINLCYEYISKYIPEHPLQPADNSAAKILYVFGCHDFDWNRLNHAAKLVERSIDMYQRLATPTFEEKRALLVAQHRLVSFHLLRGPLNPPLSYEESLDRLDTFLVSSTSLLGPTARLTLAILDSKALCLRSLGRYEDALEVHLRALNGTIDTLGLEDLDTFGTMHNIAILYEELGDFETAEQHYQRSTELSIKVLGPKHWETLNGLRSLADMYVRMERYEAALKLLLEAKEGMEDTLGEFNEGTGRVYTDLAVLYQKLEMWEEAENMARKACGAAELMFDEESREVVSARWLLELMENRQPVKKTYDRLTTDEEAL